MVQTYFKYVADGLNATYTSPAYNVNYSGLVVSKNGINTTDYTKINDTTIQLNVMPTAGSIIEIYRTTTDTRLVNYTDGTTLNARTLDLDGDHSFSLMQDLNGNIERTGQNSITESKAYTDQKSTETLNAAIDYTSKARSKITKESTVATTGQTIINIVTEFILGTNAIMVFVNGIYQETTSYVEGTQKITFTSGLIAGDVVEIIVYEVVFIDINQVLIENVSVQSNGIYDLGDNTHRIKALYVNTIDAPYIKNTNGTYVVFQDNTKTYVETDFASNFIETGLSGATSQLIFRNGADLKQMRIQFDPANNKLQFVNNAGSEILSFQDNGYLKTAGSVAIKTKKLTGTTGATEGSTTNIAHGLTYSKILSCEVMVQSTTGTAGKFKENFTNAPGYQFSTYTGSASINVTLHATSSENLLNAPITVFITYEE